MPGARPTKRRKLELSEQEPIQKTTSAPDAAYVSPIKAIRDRARINALQSPTNVSNFALSPSSLSKSHIQSALSPASPNSPSRFQPLSRTEGIFKQFSSPKKSPLKDVSSARVSAEPVTPSKIISVIPSVEIEKSGNSTEGGNVRSSGRARRLTEKLREEGRTPDAVQSQPKIRRISARGSTPRSQGRPSSLKNDDTLSAALAQGLSSKKRSNKENIAPSTQSGTDIQLTATESVRKKQVAVPSAVPPRARLAVAADQLSIPVEEVTEIEDDSSLIEGEHITAIQEVVLGRLTGKTAMPLHGLADECNKVSTIIDQVITVGESNSLLLIGARGSGKTALIDQILRQQREDHPHDFHVVRLNGFIHTDDKLALRDIWRQLGHEMESDEADMTSRSHADTLSMLLALLSHPMELDQGKAADHVAKSVVFILDEFDLFATHPRQTLLYNLFDIAQSRKAPIAVIGLTTRIDAVESLEKRVKSRFSHRYVYLNQCRNCSDFIDICKAALLMENKPAPHPVSSRLTRGTSFDIAAEHWNRGIDMLLRHSDFLLHINKVYHRTRSIPDLFATLILPLSTLGSTTASVSQLVQHILSSLSLSDLGPNSKLDQLSALSTLQTGLLVCAARQNAIYSIELVTFNLAYEEYKSIASKAKIQASASGVLGATSRVSGKEVARAAWQDLVAMGMILDDGRGGRVDVALEELARSGADLGQWTKWCKEI